MEKLIAILWIDEDGIVWTELDEIFTNASIL